MEGFFSPKKSGKELIDDFMNHFSPKAKEHKWLVRGNAGKEICTHLYERFTKEAIAPGVLSISGCKELDGIKKPWDKSSATMLNYGDIWVLCWISKKLPEDPYGTLVFMPKRNKGDGSFKCYNASEMRKFK